MHGKLAQVQGARPPRWTLHCPVCWSPGDPQQLFITHSSYEFSLFFPLFFDLVVLHCLFVCVCMTNIHAYHAYGHVSTLTASSSNPEVSLISCICILCGLTYSVCTEYSLNFGQGSHIIGKPPLHGWGSSGPMLKVHGPQTWPSTAAIGG